MKTSTLCLFLVAIALLTPSAFAQSDDSKNLLRNGDMEAYEVGPVPDEKFNSFWTIVHPNLRNQNTYFTVTTEKARSGKKSLRLELTPESAQRWQQFPAKDDTDSLFLHYSLSPKTNLTPLAAKKVVLSMWVYVEKGGFLAQLRCRVSRADSSVPDIIRGELMVEEQGKWVQVKLEGKGLPNLTRANFRLEFEPRGNFLVYVDDVYFGPAD
jgi:hypothetical protein